MTEVRETTYYHRMGDNVPDKIKRIGPHVKGPYVLDVGAADRSLTEELKKLPQTTAVDCCDIAPLDDQMIKCDATEIHRVFGKQEFDTVVMSSVLHEVWSQYSLEWLAKYGGDDDHYNGDCIDIGHCPDCAGDRGWYEAVRSAWASLKPGGRLVIRDGVRPPKEDMIQVWLNPEMTELAERFTTECPWVWNRDEDFNLQYVKDTKHMIDPEKYPGYLKANRRADLVAEFLFTATWGRESWEHEVLEKYCAVSLDSMKKILQKLDWEFIKGYSYTQPGYRQRNLGKLSVMPPWPASNCIVVAEKPA